MGRRDFAIVGFVYPHRIFQKYSFFSISQKRLQHGVSGATFAEVPVLHGHSWLLIRPPNDGEVWGAASVSKSSCRVQWRRRWLPELGVTLWKSLCQIVLLHRVPRVVLWPPHHGAPKAVVGRHDDVDVGHIFH